jgi:DNA-binding beta-propeller fold protein YncE
MTTAAGPEPEDVEPEDIDAAPQGTDSQGTGSPGAGSQPGRRRLRKSARVLILVSFAITAVLAWKAAPVIVGAIDPPRVLPAGAMPVAMAISPDGRTLYAADVNGSGPPYNVWPAVTPVDLATGRAGKPFDVLGDPAELAVAAGGRMLYVMASNDVTPVNLVTGTVGSPIDAVFGDAQGMLASPDGRTLYVITVDPLVGGTTAAVVPVDTATGRPGTPIPVSYNTDALAIAPDGRTLYAAAGNIGPHGPTRVIVSINTATGKAGKAIQLPSNPYGMVVSPDGRTLYALCTYINSMGENGPRTLLTVDVATGRVSRSVTVSPQPSSISYAPSGEIVISPDGRTVYVMDGRHTVTPVSAATGRPGAPIATTSPFSSAWNSGLLIAPDGRTLYVAEDDGITVIPLPAGA